MISDVPLSWLKENESRGVIIHSDRWFGFAMNFRFGFLVLRLSIFLKDSVEFAAKTLNLLNLCLASELFTGVFLFGFFLATSVHSLPFSLSEVSSEFVLFLPDSRSRSMVAAIVSSLETDGGKDSVLGWVETL